jgi:hypothetical protein
MKALGVWLIGGFLVAAPGCDLLSGSGSGSASARATDSAVPTAASSSTAAATAPATSAPAGTTSAAATATAAASPKTELVETDLSSRGTHWKGWSVKAPAGAKLSDEKGATRIEAPGFDIVISLKKPHPKKIKSAVEKSAKASSSKVTWTTDSPEALAWTVESSGTKSYFFLEVVKVEKKKVGCQSTPSHGADTEQQVATMRDACQSIHKQ